MNRLDATFAALRARGETALLPYLTVGYPSPDSSVALARALLAAGADGLELGVPFSDPLADGPTLQHASQQSLAQGTRLDDTFALARALRADSAAPLVVMSYFNPIQHRGLAQFCATAAAAGIDGLIVPDLPLEEAAPLRAACAAQGLAAVAMVAPTTPEERLAAICREAEGFVYCVAVVGVTGARGQLAADLPSFLARVRRHTSVPCVVGFGIARPEHVASVSQHADGAIVASALVDLLERTRPAERPAAASDYIRAMKAACRGTVVGSAGATD